MTASTIEQWPTRRRAAFASLLALTMASSTFAFTTFSVLSGPLLDTFAIARWQLGALVTVAAAVGAVLSPPMGSLADRIGGRNALLVTLAVSGFCLAGIALSPAYGAVLGAAVAAGAAQSMANPATNKLISLHGSDGGRGMLTGLKQSGVQVGVFLGGALLPLGSQTLGWRPTLLAAATLPAAGVVAALRLLPASDAFSGGANASANDRTAFLRSPFLLRLALYGLLVGAGWSAVFTYLPDYGRNALGWDPRLAGLLVSAAGLCGVAGRIGWSWYAEHRSDAPRTLIILAVLGATAVMSVLMSSQMAPLLWVGAAVLGASSGSWNSVGMFAVIARLPEQTAGAASGIVMFGFLVGLGAGAPAFGWSVDVTGGYAAGLLGAVAVHLLGTATAVRLRGASMGGLGK